MGKKHQEGFTLIELLVLMMVLAAALGFGIPAFGNFMAGSRMQAAGNDLLSSLQAARSEALTRNRPVTVCASSNAGDSRPDCSPDAALLAGWIAFVDEDADAAVDEAEPVLLAHGPVAEAIRSQPRSGVDAGPPQYLAFRGDGALQSIDALGPPVRNLQLCDERGDRVGGDGRAAGRWIALSPDGRARLLDRAAMVQGARNPLGGCGTP